MIMGTEVYSEGNQLLHDIVYYDRIPTGIQDFWNVLTQSGDGTQRWNIISVLNRMLKQGIPDGIDLMSWYEIFRDIFIMRTRDKESEKEKAKTPLFSTFDRTFEQLAFLPEYWFDCSEPGRRGNRIPPLNPARLLFSFERYMYDLEGGACWSALDWGMPKYCFRVVCESGKHPKLNIAAILLTAQNIANGKMGLYVGEKTDVNLAYAGLPGGGRTGDPLLKYYHFDRFTGMSFIRKHELELDADRMSENAMFEPQWQYLAMMAELILRNNSARATKTTCSRVSTGSFVRALNVLKSINALGGVPTEWNDKAVAVLSRIEDAVKQCRSLTKDERKALFQSIDNEIEKLNTVDAAAPPPMLQSVDWALKLLDAPNFTGLEPRRLLNMIGLKDVKFISSDFYLREQGINSAEGFWDKAEDVFNTVRDTYGSIYTQTVKTFTREEFSRHAAAGLLSLSDRDAEDLKRILLNGQLDELRGRMKGLRLRSALKTLLLGEQFEMNCGQMARILDLDFNDEFLSLYFPLENRDCCLPGKWLTADVAPQKAGETLRFFCLEILTEFSRSSKTGRILRDFVKRINGTMVQNASDRLWDIFFKAENEAVCFDRWMLSLDKSIEILAGKDKKYETQMLPKGEERSLLLEENRREFSKLTSGKAFDRDSALKRLREFNGFSLENVLPSNIRNLVILDLIARLMVSTADITPFDAMWGDDRMLKIFFTHLLYAAPKRTDHPLLFHLGIYSDKLLRDSRSGNDQRDNIDRLLKHEFDNAGERCLFLLMLVKYLKREEKPQAALKAIIDNPAMAAFVSPERLIRLKKYL